MTIFGIFGGKTWKQGIKEVVKGMIDGSKCKGNWVRFFGFFVYSVRL
ncbi:hypothetical protein COLO4_04622 [Corchorus olitorius]|uniref:Uncharacterized protein n=1 Tax=Corchorus olitorius TaxID=93759 RepID=A0A1R3KTC5_9ROSI|nr:hypothetical protein COLO4_04622 [Corchorus olitorius]